MKYTNTELHFHTAETSWCANMSACDSIPLYKERGYDLVCVTDHFNERYFQDAPAGCSKELWKKCCERWFAGWYAAREAGEKCGLTVIHAAEFQLKGFASEMLVYGMTDEMFLENPRPFDMSPKDFSRFAKENGLFITLAHPFRHDDRPDPVFYNGAEVYNGVEEIGEDEVRTPEHNILARDFAAKNGLVPTCGQDFHKKYAMRGIMTRFHGEVKDSRTLVEKLFARDFDMILLDGEVRSGKDV